MKKADVRFTITENRTLNRDNFLLRCHSSYPLSHIKPGQFVAVKVDGSPDTFLRRPISVNEVDVDSNTLDLLIRIAGKGTEKLSQLSIGDHLDIMLPLGNCFTLPKKEASVLLVGGGVGIAPLLMLARHLAEKQIKTEILMGGRNAEAMILTAEFEKYGAVHITTEDGSVGHKGFVTNHPVMATLNYDYIYCCGPEPMMKAVAKQAESKAIPCEVSLENTMACGIGACLCCVTETTSGNKCVCTEGPVFLSTSLKDFTK